MRCETFHRALADSEMAARLWMRMVGDICDRYQLPQLSFLQMQQLSRKPRHAVPRFLEGFRVG
ncbi:MAG: hypothetical protein OHK0039_00730 [Bacteroidia bacterium]